jgi:hypothetical protein
MLAQTSGSCLQQEQRQQQQQQQHRQQQRWQMLQIVPCHNILEL